MPAPLRTELTHPSVGLATYKTPVSEGRSAMGSPNRCEVVVLRCQGRIVLGHESRLLCAAIRQQGRSVMLDLSKVDAIDAAGIGALVSLQAAGVYLRLMNPAKQVLETLGVTRLDSVL